MIMSINVNKIRTAVALLFCILMIVIVAAGFFPFRTAEKNDEAVIKESACGFISEITDRDYRSVTGREGYDFFSQNLMEKVEKGCDEQKTKEKYRREKIVQKLVDKPEVYVEMRGKSNADALIYYKEKLTSESKIRRIFAVLYYKQNRSGKWKIDDFQIERY